MRERKKDCEGEKEKKTLRERKGEIYRERRKEREGERERENILSTRICEVCYTLIFHGQTC